MSTDLAVSVKELLESHGKPPREVYLDHENSGVIFPEALKAMVEAYGRGYGHPSITHKVGWESYELLYESAEVIAGAIGASTEELTFTHSGTEANNLAVMGSAFAAGRKGRMVVSEIERLSVISRLRSYLSLALRSLKSPSTPRVL